jgi:DNA-binding LacI/PurR family transcriptional regulator
MKPKEKKQAKQPETITLKMVAEHVGLAAGTVSLVLNHTPQSMTIPQHTRDRVFAAAREMNYRPNPFARALRTKQTPLAADDSPEMGSGSRALVFVGAEDFLRAVHAIRQAGLRVPGDVSVVGADRFPVPA